MPESVLWSSELLYRENEKIGRVKLFCMSRSVLLSVVLVCLAKNAVAQTETSTNVPPRARILLADCRTLPFDRDAFLEVLRVELLGYGTVLQTNHELLTDMGIAVIISVDIPSCNDRSARIEVRLEHSETQRSARSSIQLGDTPISQRSRVLALAIAELLAERWLDLSYPDRLFDGSADTQEAADMNALRQRTEALEARLIELEESGGIQERNRVFSSLVQRAESRIFSRDRRTHQWSIDTLAGLRLFPAAETSVMGGRLGATCFLARLGPLPISLSFAIDGRYGERFDPIGDVNLATIGWVLDLLIGMEGRRIAFGFGPQTLVAYAWGRGQPSRESAEGHLIDTVVCVLSLELVLRLKLWSKGWIFMGINAGYTVSELDVRAEDRRVGGFYGPVLNFDLGISVTP